MRVVLVSNMYAYPGNWDKLDALSQHVDLAVVMPSAWRTTELHPMAAVPARPAGARWSQRRLDTYLQFNGNPFRYVYHPGQLMEAIRDHQPDLVHVEQEPESLSLLQLSLLKPRFNYHLIFVAWENVNPLRLGWGFRTINFRMADAGIVGNQAALERCRRLGYARRLALIPQYGFDIDPSAILPRAAHQPFVVGYAGRLVPEKGLGTLLDARRRVPGVMLHLAGDGPLADVIGRERDTRLLGTLPRSELGRFWSGIDALVIPSLTTRKWAEQFGRVIVEAMAAGTPVIGSSSGAIPEVIGDAGLVVPEGDAAALAVAIRTLRDDPELRRDLITRGVERVRRHYATDVIMGRTVQFYRDVMGGER